MIKRIGCFGVLGAVALLILLFVIGSMHQSQKQSSSIPQPSSSASASAAPEPKGITYQVEGTAESVLVTYTNEQNGMQQEEISLPWEKNLPSMGFGKSVVLTATNRGGAGTITCKIIRDGNEWRNLTSTAAYGTATCNGIVGM
jgi:hypothetical protein